MRFVLVHGGFHGAWCWSRTIPELEALGHQAVAIDLPGHGSRRDEPSPLAARRAAILDVLEDGDILVGHSGGGYDITVAAGAAPERIGHLIYVAGGLPVEGRSAVDATGGATSRDEVGNVEIPRLTTEDTDMWRFVDRNSDGRMECKDYEAVHSYLYHDCDDATAQWAYSMLTPQPTECLVTPISVPRFWESDIPRSFIVCLQDRAQSRAMAAATVERLGVEPLPIDTSHSPFLSRPRELAGLLVRATTTRPIGPFRPA